MALRNLRTYFKENNRNDFIQLLENECIVSEKIQASSFHVQNTIDGFIYYKSGNKEPMNIIDRTIVSFYENAINYFKSLDNQKSNKMPTNWKFGFDYITNNKPIDIEYDRIPKNNLILTHIQVISNNDKTQIKKVIRDPKVLNTWADYLNVERPPIIFEGKLSQDQINEIINLMEISDQDYNQKFKDNTFTKDVYKLFNQSYNKSTLQDSLDKPIDSIVINFKLDNNLKSFKLGQEGSTKEDRTISDLYQIIVLDMVEFLLNINYKDYKIKGNDENEKYLNLICDIFNQFINENSAKYIGLNFNSFEFVIDKEEFSINSKFIENQETLRLIENEIIAELFKIMLSTFRNNKKKETSLLTKEVIDQINTIIKNIQNYIMNNNSNENFNNIHHYRLSKINPIYEKIDINYKEKGSNPVNIFVGRFQPFTKGHSKVINTLYKQNGYPIVIFLVKSKRRKKGDEFKRPYDEELQLEMLKKVKKDLPIEEVYIINQAAIDVLFDKLRADDYEPVLWGTGSDRLKGYGAQVHKEEYRNDLNVRPDFDTFEIERDDNDISATQVRHALLDGDYESFEKLTPDAIHEMYDKLKIELEQSMSNNEENNKPMNFYQFLQNK